MLPESLIFKSGLPLMKFPFMLMEAGSSVFSLLLSIFVVVIVTKLQGSTFHILIIAWYKVLPYYWLRVGPDALIMMQTRGRFETIFLLN